MFPMRDLTTYRTRLLRRQIRRCRSRFGIPREDYGCRARGNL